MESDLLSCFVSFFVWQSCQVNTSRWTPPGTTQPRTDIGRWTPPVRAAILDDGSPSNRVPPSSLAGRLLRSSSTSSDLPSPTELLEEVDSQEATVPPAGVHGVSLTAHNVGDRIAWEFQTERKVRHKAALKPPHVKMNSVLSEFQGPGLRFVDNQLTN